MITEPVQARAGGVAVVPAERVVRELYTERYGSLVGLARLLVDSHAEAEEVVQEGFVRLYASFSKVRDPDKALAFLRATILNEARGRLRRRRLERTTVQAAGPVATADTADSATPERATVLAAVRDLPRRQMECIALRYYSGCTDREIAASLGIGTGSVKKHLHRAHGALGISLEHLR